jgi:phage shock protein A
MRDDYWATLAVAPASSLCQGDCSMNLLERVFTLLRANLNSVVEKADDPEKALRQLQLDMRNQLVQVKTQVATAITESRKMQNRASEKQKEAQAWYKKAEDALQHNNETAARDALTRYNDRMRLAHRYTQQQHEQEQLVATMRRALSQLESKIAEVETTIELLVTRKRNALLQQRVYDALGKSNNPSDKERANRVQDAVVEAEARARAMADLYSRDLDVQLEQLSDEELVEQQLKDLKTHKRAPHTPPLLAPGSEQESRLLSPTPKESEPSRKRAQATPLQQGEQPANQENGLTPPQKLDIEELKRLMEK